MTNFKGFLKSTRTLILIEIPIKATTFLTTIILIRLMSSSEYGQYTSLLAVATLIISFSGGIQTVLIRNAATELAFDKQWNHILFSIKFQYGIILFSSIVLFFVIDNIFILIGLIFYCIGVSGFTLLSVGHQAINKLKIYASINMLRNFIIIAIILLLAKYSVLKSDYVFYLYGLASFIFLIIFYSFHHSGNIIQSSSLKIARLIKENIYLIIYYAFISIYTQLDVLISANYLSNEDLAIYGVGLRYYYLSLLFLPPIVNSVRIYTSKNGFDNNVQKQIEYLKDWFFYSTPLIIFIGIIGLFASPLILNILNGSNYYESIAIFRYMLFGSMAMYIFCPIVSLLITNNCYITLIAISIFSIIFKFLLFWYLLSSDVSLPLLGMGLTLSIIFYNILGAYQFSRYIKKSY
tara:strand:+ start:7833 stop:9053 length:1221 start_codon:yes stop_codon:yes gene_type:complete